MSTPLLVAALVEGERVRLREARESDAATAFDLLHGNHDVLDWLIWDGPNEVDELREWYAMWRNDTPGGTNYHFAIEDRVEGTFLGTLGIRFEGHAGQGDVGYWVRSDAWGRGIATEAVRLANWLGFRHLQSVLHYATVFVGNEASARVLVKNGYVEDEAGASKVAKGGKLVERRFFSISRRAWAAREGSWEPRFSVVELE